MNKTNTYTQVSFNNYKNMWICLYALFLVFIFELTNPNKLIEQEELLLIQIHNG